MFPWHFLWAALRPRSFFMLSSSSRESDVSCSFPPHWPFSFRTAPTVPPLRPSPPLPPSLKNHHFFSCKRPQHFREFFFVIRYSRVLLICLPVSAPFQRKKASPPDSMPPFTLPGALQLRSFQIKSNHLSLLYLSPSRTRLFFHLR